MIQINAAKCNKCDDVIASFNTHDFKKCKCEAIAVDGGHDYLRRTANEMDCAELSLDDEMEQPILTQRHESYQTAVNDTLDQLITIDIDSQKFSDQVYKLLILDRGLTIIRKINDKNKQKTGKAEQGSGESIKERKW